MIKIFKVFLTFGLATSLEKIIGFILIPIYTNLFSVHEYGLIELIQSVLMTVVMFGVLQLETSLQRYYFDYKGIRKKLLISTVYFYVLLLSCLVCFVLILLLKHILELLSIEGRYYWAFFITLLQIPFFNLNMLNLLLLRYEKKNQLFLVIVIVKFLFMMSFTYLFLFVFKLSINGVFLSQLFTLIISTLISTLFIREMMIFKVNRYIKKDLFNYALPQVPARIGSVVLAYGNRFFIVGILSITSVAFYSLALKWASIIQLFNTTFIMLWNPFMYAKFKDLNHPVIFSTTLKLVSCIVVIIISFITLFSYELIKFTSTEEYIEAHKYVGLLAVFYSLYLIKEIIDIGPKLKEKTYYISISFTCSILVNIVLLFLLTDKYGVLGVVSSMVLTNLVLVLVSWRISNKLHFIPFNLPHFIVIFFLIILLNFIIINYNISFLTRVFICIISFGVFGVLSYKEWNILKKYI